MKPFTRSSKAGFTLVELIIVIAILAILAGVAIPVYSGYIKKANEAADQQLLAAVNAAFGAACLENGRDPRSLSAAASLANGKLESVAPYNDSFMRYFSGNENNKFKVFASLVYNRTDGVFKGYGEGETITFTYGDVTVSVDAAQLSAYLGSTFDELGSSAMTAEIDRLVGSAISAIAEENAGAGFGNSEEFKSFLSTLAWEDDEGVTHTYEWDTMTSQQKANSLVLYAASLANKINIGDSISSLLNEGNITIDDLRPGTKAEQISSTAAKYAMMLAYCSDENAKLTIVTRGDQYEVKQSKNPDYKTIANATYASNDDRDAAITAWVKNNYGQDATWDPKTTNSSGIITAIYVNKPGTTDVKDASTWFDNYEITSYGSIVGSHFGLESDYDGMWDIFKQSQEYQNYITTQGSNDLNAYVSALQMVNSNTANVDIDSVLSNGWENGGIQSLLSYITGN